MSEDDIGAEGEEQAGGNEGSSSSEEMVPLSALLAERGRWKRTLDTEVDKLKGEIESLKQKPAKEYTRQELQQMVDAGQLSEVEADRIRDEQVERRLEAKINKRVEETASSKQRDATLNAEFAKYTDVHPEILVDGSEKRLQVEKEFQRQLALGKSNSLQTELDALMVVFGSPDRLQKGREKPKQTHQEGDSDGGEEEKGGAGAPKLPAHVKGHYEKLISMGKYKGWDDPKLKTELSDYGRW